MLVLKRCYIFSTLTGAFLMFDFLFGGKQKIELIRELLEQRMRDIGYDDMHFRLQIKQMGNMQLMGTPEGTLVSIIETVIKLQRSGVLITQIIDKLEDHRRRIGHDASSYLTIKQTAQSRDDAGSAIPMYCKYRLDLEYPTQPISDEHFSSAFEQITIFLMKN